MGYEDREEGRALEHVVLALGGVVISIAHPEKEGDYTMHLEGGAYVITVGGEEKKPRDLLPNRSWRIRGYYRVLTPPGLGYEVIRVKCPERGHSARTALKHVGSYEYAPNQWRGRLERLRGYYEELKQDLIEEARTRQEEAERAKREREARERDRLRRKELRTRKELLEMEIEQRKQQKLKNQVERYKESLEELKQQYVVERDKRLQLKRDLYNVKERAKEIHEEQARRISRLEHELLWPDKRTAVIGALRSRSLVRHGYIKKLSDVLRTNKSYIYRIQRQIDRGEIFPREDAGELLSMLPAAIYEETEESIDPEDLYEDPESEETFAEVTEDPDINDITAEFNRMCEDAPESA
jgi:hypothetical protein